MSVGFVALNYTFRHGKHVGLGIDKCRLVVVDSGPTGPTWNNEQ